MEEVIRLKTDSNLKQERILRSLSNTKNEIKALSVLTKKVMLQ